MIGRVLQFLARSANVMLAMQPVMYSFQLGSHRIPVVSFFMGGGLLYLHFGISSVETDHRWATLNASFTAMLLPVLTTAVLGFFYPVLNARKVAQTSETGLLPGLRWNLSAALMLQIFCSAVLLMALVMALLMGIREAAIFLVFLWALSVEAFSPQLRKFIFWLMVVIATLILVIGVTSNIAIFRKDDLWTYRLGFTFAFGSVIVTALSLIAASIIRPRVGVPVTLVWWLSLWVPNVYVLATRQYILHLMYEHFTETGVHVFTALATSTWAIWLLLNTRSARLQSSGGWRGRWHVVSLRETLGKLATLPYALQLKHYTRHGLGGMASLSMLSLGSAIHFGTVWVWLMGLTWLMMVIYTYVSPRIFESAGIWLGAQFIIWAGTTAVMLMPRTLIKRQAELKLAYLLPGTLSHAGIRRNLASTAFIASLLALVPAALIGGMLIQLPVMPEYPTLNLRGSIFDHADYWLLAVLLLLGAAANGWRILLKFDWMNVTEEKDWFFIGWFLMIFSPMFIKLTKLGITPEWKLLVIVCNAAFMLWLFWRVLYGENKVFEQHRQHLFPS